MTNTTNTDTPTIIARDPKPAMNHTHLKHALAKHGYTFKSYVACPVCGPILEAAKASQGIPADVTPVWANPTTAFKLYKKGQNTTIACPCGFRGTMKFKFTDKPICSVPGCGSTLSKYDTNGICNNPKHIEEGYVHAQGGQAQNMGTPMAPEGSTSADDLMGKQCKQAGCTNTVPEAHLVNCTTCRAANRQPKGAASKNFTLRA